MRTFLEPLMTTNNLRNSIYLRQNNVSKTQLTCLHITVLNPSEPLQVCLKMTWPYPNLSTEGHSDICINTLYFYCSKNRRNFSTDSSYSKSLNLTLEAQCVSKPGMLSNRQAIAQQMLFSKILSKNSFIYYQTLNGHT